MKQIITILIASIFAIGAMAQDLKQFSSTYREQCKSKSYIEIFDEHSLKCSIRKKNANKATATIIEKVDSIYSYDESNVVIGKQYSTYYANNNLRLSSSYKWNDFLNDFYESYRTEYDVNGNRTLYIRGDKNNNTGEDVNRHKEEYGYNANNNETLYYSYNWDGTNWVYDNKMEYSYNTNNNLTLRQYYDWDDSIWVKKYKIEQSFNSIGNLILYYWYFWEDTGWVISSKTEISYDTNNNQILDKGYFWNNTDWVNSSITEYSYDVNDNLILTQDFLLDSTDWVNYSKTEYSYDVNNNEVLRQFYSWNGSDLVNYSKTEYSYDVSNNQTLFHWYSWDGTDWVSVEKYEYSYDANSNLILYQYYYFDDTQGIRSFKIEYNYDLNYLLSEIANPWGNYFFKNKLIFMDKYRWGNDTWISDGKADVYYSDIDSLISEHSNTNLYPNPAKSQLTISNELFLINKIEIINTNGKRVKQFVANSNQIVVDISGFSKGIYIVKVTTNKGVSTEKLVIE